MHCDLCDKIITSSTKTCQTRLASFCSQKCLDRHLEYMRQIKRTDKIDQLEKDKTNER